jgi:hypothetical protein
VPHEQVDPRFRAPGRGIEIGKLCAEQLLDGVGLQLAPYSR